jgi:zinc transporter 5/7
MILSQILTLYLQTESSNNAEVHLTSLAIIPLLAFVLCHLQPMATRSLQTVAAPAAVFRYSFPAALGTAALLPFLTTFQLPTLLDMVTPLLTYYTFSGKLHVGAPSRTPAARLVRTYMKTILSNPESRKIFYFLMLNLAYMFVQMLYGVWTNSLGLISDGESRCCTWLQSLT